MAPLKLTGGPWGGFHGPATREQEIKPQLLLSLLFFCPFLCVCPPTPHTDSCHWCLSRDSNPGLHGLVFDAFENTTTSWSDGCRLLLS